MALPKISIIAPILGRPEGVRRLLDSIAELHYPQELLEVLLIEDEPRLGVPLRVAEGLARSTGEYLVFAANDMEFTPSSVLLAYLKAREGYGLVAFNTGPISEDEGNICEHFLISREFVYTHLDGEIFDTDFTHCGCDNLLWAKAKKSGNAISCREAVVHHHHFSKGGVWDEIYALAWGRVDEDRAILANKLALID